MPVWLHLHVQSAELQGKRLTIFNFMQLIVDSPSAVLAAHLKSDFYRGKGKNWQAARRLAGDTSTHIERSKASVGFIKQVFKALPQQVLSEKNLVFSLIVFSLSQAAWSILKFFAIAEKYNMTQDPGSAFLPWHWGHAYQLGGARNPACCFTCSAAVNSPLSAMVRKKRVCAQP
ncbi:MAG: hypothetical protein HC848_06200 [Limnobacter sp.]|nr:hypothetical protein [Limnobacter sp.]